MFENLVQKFREFILGDLAYLKDFKIDHYSNLIGDAIADLIFYDEIDLEIDTERVGEGVTSQVPLPKLGDPGAHAFDLYTPIDFTVPANGSFNVPIGRKFKLPRGYGALLWSRSGLAAKLGIERGAGLIDCTYGEEWIVVLRNHSDVDAPFKSGERICQAFLLPSYNYKFNEVQNLTVDNDRGGGLGSTGMT